MKAKDITVKQLLSAVKATQEYARTHGYKYGDSHATPPTTDKIISCDRLIAKALYDLGFTDQPKGGMVCGMAESYLTSHGFEVARSVNDVKAGSILLVRNAHNALHMFVVNTFDGSKTGRYDCGSDSLIQIKQPFVTPTFPYTNIVGVYNIPEKGTHMKGIDISHHNGWPFNSATEKAYKESDFVIIKATQWMSAYKYESFFPKAMDRSLKDGKLSGAYHYATGLTAKKEAQYFVSVVKPYLGKIVLAIDWESIDNSSWGSKTWCKTFCDEVYRLTGIYPVLYTGSKGCADNGAIADKCPLWFAGYPDSRTTWNPPAFPARYSIGAWKAWTIWQYTSGGGVDRNTSILTKKEWQAMCKIGKVVEEKTKATAADILAVLKSWIGKSREKQTHKDIIDLYNSYTPHPRGYTVKYTDDYCATTVSAAFIACNAVSELGGIECGVERFIEDVFIPNKIWEEDGKVTPEVGWIVCYNWDDKTQPNDGWADHIGVVESVNKTKKTFVVIEGNMNGVVGRRTVSIGWGYIRGFAKPKYGTASTAASTTTKTDTTVSHYTGTYPALPPRGFFQNGDGITTYTNYPTQIKRIQMFLNWAINAKLDVDGRYGPLTTAAVNKFKKKVGLKQDGCWNKSTLTAAKAFTK